MYAFLSSKKLIAVKSKSIIKINCRCQSWTSTCVKHNRQFILHQPVLLKPLNIPCPLKSSRLFSTLIPSSSRLPPLSQYVETPAKEKRDALNLLYIGAYRSATGAQHSRLILIRHLHAGSSLYDKEPLKPSSKLEETVQAIKQDIKESTETTVEKAPPPKKTLRQKIVHEILHYYHGFRLLFIDINVSSKLVWRVLNGNSLTRREHRLLVRTVSDLFRLLPFSVFIIVPFMELLLPLAIKMFPGMLPSTFQTATEKDDKMKQALKVKLEMAKFLQKTLDDMAVVGKGHRSDSAKEFAEFFVKLRTSGTQATNEEIMKFSKLFEDEITLDSLSRPQLTALCRVLEIQTLGTNNFLRFQLRMKLRSLAADDKVIEKEGIDMLTTSELQQACRARGMRAYGMSTDKLRSQLKQWLDLSLHQKVPPSLLLLSRALLLPESSPTSDLLKATISVLPDTVATQTKAAIGEREGKIDNKTKIEIIKEEQRLIKEEHQEQKDELQKGVAAEDKEALMDKAPVITQSDSELLRSEVPPLEAAADLTAALGKKKELTSNDLETLEDALDTLSKDKKRLLVEKEELDDLKEELAEYKEDVDDLQQVMKTVDKTKQTEVHETKAAQRLYKKVNSMIGKMDLVLSELEQKERNLKEDLQESTQLEDKEVSNKSQALVSIEELMAAIRQIQKVPDDSLVERISEVLQKMDEDRDGSIAVDDVLKVIELVGKENVKIGKKQLDEIIDLIGKEEKIELEGQIERVLAKETQQMETAKQEKRKKLDDLEKELAAAKAITMAKEDRAGNGPKPPPFTPPPPPSPPTTRPMSATPPTSGKAIEEPKDPQDKTKTL